MISAPNPERSTLGRQCALCGKPQDAAYRPFCSKRCADLDLGRWLTGDYVIEDGEVGGNGPYGTDQDN